MYLAELAEAIRAHVPERSLPDGDDESLFRMYAVLLRAKGESVTQSDVHDAWAAWMSEKDPSHKALVPYDALDDETQDEDRIFATAIRSVSAQVGQTGPSNPDFMEVLFPLGPPNEASSVQRAFDLYKIMVDSSERLVSRRQGVNTFFLTINGALLTAAGLIVQSSGDRELGGLGIAVLASAGVLLCAAWRSLIRSFGQLNSGKFKVINTIERYFPAAIYAAEWEALGRGENPKIYRSFTEREIWVPNALLGLQLVTAVTALLVFFGVVRLG